MKIVMICSGGLDSTVLYYYQKKIGNEILPVNFSYGSKHNPIERTSALILIPGLKLIDINLSFLKSSLLSGQEAIPHGHYQAENMKSTVVPFRNGIMLSFAIAIAESEKADCVMLGSHSGDHAIYPDCRPEFTEAISRAAIEGTYNNIKVISPFNSMTKGDIVKVGASIGIEEVMAKTWTCYEGKEIHCGKCGSCTERKEAFAVAGIKDETKYEE